jgi:GAF domain-containing protein
MRRRDKAGGKAVKTQRNKTLTRCNAPKVARGRRHLATSKETNIAQLTRERDEALEQQATTADVLKVISRSTFNLQTVLDTLVQSAARLCDADIAVIGRPRGTTYYFEATYGYSPELAEFVANHPAHIDRGTISGRVLVERKIIQVADVLADPEYTYEGAQKIGFFRTILGVPLLREGTPIGVLTLSRNAVRPFTDRQIELVVTFAAQAVIAIENARLLSELRQSLEQQTATSEVLRVVISRSATDLGPVFETIAHNSVHLCGATYGAVFRFDGEMISFVAHHDLDQAGIDAVHRMFPMRPDTSSLVGRAIIERDVLHIADVASESKGTYAATQQTLGIRTFLGVPMLRDGNPIGAIALYRREVGLFSDRQIELVKAFADQAVIAIENARLLNELRESLQQQTTTADVLKVISRSAFDLQTVLQTLVEGAARLCDADKAFITRERDGTFYRAEAYGFSREFMDHIKGIPIEPERGNASGRALLEGRVVQIPDVLADAEFTMIEAQRLADFRTVLAVPMLREGVPIGVLILMRSEVRPFTDKQIELVTTFADQAAIAIENVRLLKELRERTVELEAQSQEVTKLNQQLEQRVAEQVSEIERMSRLRRFLPPQVADLIIASGTEKRLESHRREITALFCDLRGFTGFSEKSDPEDVMSLLREYHAAIGEIIVKYSGTLEHYAGDGVMVFFNDPIPVSNPALQAVQTALEMRMAIEALTEKWRRLGHELGFGVGIAHGFATLGTIGFEGRFDYAAIGTVSNVASRLCDEAKPGQILISPRVLMAVEDGVNVELVGDFTLKGISRPVAAYNVLSAVCHTRDA